MPPAEATDEYPLTEESELLDPSSESLESVLLDDSPDPEDDPPPLQEMTSKLKITTIRKKRSFFIYFP